MSLAQIGISFYAIRLPATKKTNLCCHYHSISLNLPDNASELTLFAATQERCDSNMSKNCIVVEGCGVESINGIYKPYEHGTLNGAPRFFKPGRWDNKEVQFFLNKCKVGSGKIWYISVTPNNAEPDTNADIDFYCANEDTDGSQMPPTKGWERCKHGSKPIPKVHVKSKTPTPPKPDKTTSPSPRSVTNTTSFQATPAAAPKPAVTTPTQNFTGFSIPGKPSFQFGSGVDKFKTPGVKAEEDEEYSEDEYEDSGEDASDYESCNSESEEEIPPGRNFIPNACSKSIDANSSLNGYECWQEFMDKLTEGNVDKYVDLPMIAVMGDTSSGKSSLLSNISLVDLPSSDTLTTRCPIRLQMKEAESKWACVKVIWKDRPDGEHVDFTPQKVNDANWEDLTNIIAAAQDHIIKKSGKAVARDIVCVEMRGPHCQNLTLIDLPGIVRSSGKGESDSLPEEITALMSDYLKNDRCVLLAIHP